MIHHKLGRVERKDLDTADCNQKYIAHVIGKGGMTGQYGWKNEKQCIRDETRRGPSEQQNIGLFCILLAE